MRTIIGYEIRFDVVRKKANERYCFLFKKYKPTIFISNMEDIANIELEEVFKSMSKFGMPYFIPYFIYNDLDDREKLFYTKEVNPYYGKHKYTAKVECRFDIKAIKEQIIFHTTPVYSKRIPNVRPAKKWNGRKEYEASQDAKIKNALRECVKTQMVLFSDF